ncbi:hypothetical protein EJB05_11968, partial [Eragrostis curvula]
MDKTGICSICGVEQETEFHALFNCPLARGLRELMRSVWDLPDESWIRDEGPEWLLVLLARCSEERKTNLLLLMWRAWCLAASQEDKRGVPIGMLQGLLCLLLQLARVKGSGSGTMSVRKGMKYRGYLPWTDDMDQALLDVFVEHYHKGDRTPTGILAHDGFEWDHDKDRLLIRDRNAWSRYIEKNRAAAGYQHKVVKNWDAISLIFSREHAATSEDVSTGAENGQEMASKGAEDVHEVSNSPSTSAPSSSNQGHGGPQELTQPKEIGSRKRFRTDEALFCMSGEIKNSFQISVSSDELPKEPHNTPPKEIFAALQEIPNLARDDLLKAYCILTTNDRKFESLLALPMDMRKDWLLMEIGKK